MLLQRGTQPSQHTQYFGMPVLFSTNFLVFAIIMNMKTVNIHKMFVHDKKTWAQGVGEPSLHIAVFHRANSLSLWCSSDSRTLTSEGSMGNYYLFRQQLLLFTWTLLCDVQILQKLFFCNVKWHIFSFIETAEKWNGITFIVQVLLYALNRSQTILNKHIWNVLC